MTPSAPSLTRIDLREALTTFAETGIAIWKPDFGSVFRHSGSDALDLLHRITTNSLIDLPDGSARQTVLTSEKGRIIDVPWVIKLAADELLLVSDAPGSEALQDGILRYTIIEDADLIDISSDTVRLMVFGDQATHAIVEAFPNADFSDTRGSMFSIEDFETIAIRTDAAGVTTWMIIAPRERYAEYSSRFKNLGHLSPNRALFDYVRITNRIPFAGCELSEDVNPLEASMQHLIDFDKGCYVGQEVIARLDTYDKVQRKLVAFSEVADTIRRGNIETGDRILATEGGRDIGWVSSVAAEPATDRTFGLAYVRARYVENEDIELARFGEGIALLT